MHSNNTYASPVTSVIFLLEFQCSIQMLLATATHKVWKSPSIAFLLIQYIYIKYTHEFKMCSTSLTCNDLWCTHDPISTLALIIWCHYNIGTFFMSRLSLFKSRAEVLSLLCGMVLDRWGLFFCDPIKDKLCLDNTNCIVIFLLLHGVAAAVSNVDIGLKMDK